MEENKKVEKELSRRQFFKELGYMAGGAMLLSMPWLRSQTPEKLEEIKDLLQENDITDEEEDGLCLTI